MVTVTVQQQQQTKPAQTKYFQEPHHHKANACFLTTEGTGQICENPVSLGLSYVMLLFGILILYTNLIRSEILIPLSCDCRLIVTLAIQSHLGSVLSTLSVFFANNSQLNHNILFATSQLTFLF